MTETKTPAHNHRPYRPAHLPGDERITYADGNRQIWRQLGWHGQSGAFYALGEDPSRHEPGSFSPLWLLVDDDVVLVPHVGKLDVHAMARGLFPAAIADAEARGYAKAVAEVIRVRDEQAGWLWFELGERALTLVANHLEADQLVAAALDAPAASEEENPSA